MNRHCDLFCALIVVPMQGTETTKFVAMDKDENSMIQIIRTKNARIDEINKRFDVKQAQKKIFLFFSGKRLTSTKICGIIEAHQVEQQKQKEL